MLLSSLCFLSTLSIWFLLWAQFLLKSGKALCHFHYYSFFFFFKWHLACFWNCSKKKKTWEKLVVLLCFALLFYLLMSCRNLTILKSWRHSEEEECLQCGLLPVTALPSKHVYLNNKCLHLASKAFKWRACLLKATVC